MSALVGVPARWAQRVRCWGAGGSGRRVSFLFTAAPQPHLQLFPSRHPGACTQLRLPHPHPRGEGGGGEFRTCDSIPVPPHPTRVLHTPLVYTGSALCTLIRLDQPLPFPDTINCPFSAPLPSLANCNLALARTLQTDSSPLPCQYAFFLRVFFETTLWEFFIAAVKVGSLLTFAEGREADAREAEGGVGETGSAP